MIWRALWLNALGIATERPYRRYLVLLHPKSSRDSASLSDRAMGCRTLASPVIHSIHHHNYSVYSSIPESRSPSRFMFLNFALFHVSILLRILVPLVLFLFPKPRPWYMPDFCYPDMILFNTYIPNLMYVPQSEINIDCPSNSSSVSRPKFEDSRHLVAQHISWSRVLAKHIEPWYTLSPSPAHNRFGVSLAHATVIQSVGLFW